MTKTLLLASVSSLVSSLAVLAAAQGQTPAPEGGVYTLGTINVSAPSGGAGGGTVGGTTLSADDIRLFNADRLDRALTTQAGINLDSTRGPRNEYFVAVRGFSRFQVPLYLDGVRLYLPADNRIDLGRFFTADLSEIQISKGYASVLDGPGGMGGAINLVTRKPTRALEGEISGGLSFDATGSFSGYKTSAVAGSKIGDFYIQGGVSSFDQNFFRLSDNFRPLSANENGNRRDNSEAEDWRVNVKAGWTPRVGDEYSINILKQRGEKSAPLHIYDPASSNTIRYWKWPIWDVQNISFQSRTGIGDVSYVKTRLYQTRFYNILKSYDDKNYTSQKTARAFSSYYDDTGFGGSLEAGTKLWDVNNIKIAFHARRDEHKEYQDLFSPTSFREPPQRSIEDTYSLALENTLRLDPAIDLVLGASYDWRRLLTAQDWDGTASGSFVRYRTSNGDAFNPQGALIWHYAARGDAHVSISHATRFPTLFERFSSRFGGATSNPYVDSESATNYEIGASDFLFGHTKVTGAVHYSQIHDLIQSVNIIYRGTALTQNQNVGSGHDYGLELTFRTALTSRLEFGGNYALLVRRLSGSGTPAPRPLGTPLHKAMLFADWQPIENLHLVPTLEGESDRWVTNSAQTVYYRTGAHVIANLKVGWEVVPGLEVETYVRNIFDRSYAIMDGYPLEGRSYFVGGRFRF